MRSICERSIGTWSSEGVVLVGSVYGSSEGSRRYLNMRHAMEGRVSNKLLEVAPVCTTYLVTASTLPGCVTDRAVVVDEGPLFAVIITALVVRGQRDVGQAGEIVLVEFALGDATPQKGAVDVDGVHCCGGVEVGGWRLEARCRSIGMGWMVLVC